MEMVLVKKIPDKNLMLISHENRKRESMIASDLASPGSGTRTEGNT